MNNESNDKNNDGLNIPINRILRTLGFIPNVEANPSERFKDQIIALVEKTAQRGWIDQGEGEVCAFVLVPRPSTIKDRFNVTSAEELDLNRAPLLGRMFFLSENGANGFVMPLPCESENLVTWLNENGFDEHTVALAFKDAGQIAFRRQCKDIDSIRIAIRSTPPNVSIDELESALEDFHRYELLTPHCSPKVWQPGGSKQYLPVQDAEKSIQSQLKNAIRSYFRSQVRVTIEETMAVGRLDINLMTLNSGEQGWVYWCILELKVIRSKDSKGNSVQYNANRTKCVGGLDQLDSYCQERKVSIGLLEIFDLRQDKSQDICKDKCFTAKLATLRTADVRHHQWPLFGTAEDARNAGY